MALPGLGTMRFGLRSKAVEDVNDVKTSLISSWRIGLSERLIKRELDFFATEQPLAKELIGRSFLSECLKRSYWLSYNYRRATLTFAR